MNGLQDCMEKLQNLNNLELDLSYNQLGLSVENLRSLNCSLR